MKKKYWIEFDLIQEIFLSRFHIKKGQNYADLEGLFNNELIIWDRGREKLSSEGAKNNWAQLSYIFVPGYSLNITAYMGSLRPKRVSSLAEVYK